MTEHHNEKREPRMIPKSFYCETCNGHGYLVTDVEWTPYAVQCPDCKDRRDTTKG